MGTDAQARHPQQLLRDIGRLQDRGADLPARRGAEEVAYLLRYGDGQLPRHQPQGFSGSRLNEMYHENAVSQAPVVARRKVVALSSWPGASLRDVHISETSEKSVAGPMARGVPTS